MGDGAAKVKPSKIHQAVIRKLKKGDTLATFNYDTLIEESIETKNPIWTPRFGLACTRFRRHRVRCFNGTGGAS
jgi:hypothetical protein